MALLGTTSYFILKLALEPYPLPGASSVFTVALTWAFGWLVTVRHAVGGKRHGLSGMLAGAALFGDALGELVLKVGFHWNL